MMWGSRSLPLHSAEFKKKKEKERRLRRVIYTLTALILLATPIYVSRNSHLQISSIRVEGNAATPDERIESIAASVMSGHYLWLVPKRNILLYPKGTLREAIGQEIPRLTMIELELEDDRVLRIQVSERDPEALYCQDITSISTPLECYFLDDSGYIFSLAPYFSGGVYFIYAHDKPIESPLGTSLMSAIEFRLLEHFRKDLIFMERAPRAILVGGEDYSLVLPSGGKIIWRKSDDLTLVRDNLEAFLNDPNTKKVKDFLDRVLYIDLRFENKVFYKLSS